MRMRIPHGLWVTILVTNAYIHGRVSASAGDLHCRPQKDEHGDDNIIFECRFQIKRNSDEAVFQYCDEVSCFTAQVSSTSPNNQKSILPVDSGNNNKVTTKLTLEDALRWNEEGIRLREEIATAEAEEEVSLKIQQAVEAYENVLAYYIDQQDKQKEASDDIEILYSIATCYYNLGDAYFQSIHYKQQAKQFLSQAENKFRHMLPASRDPRYASSDLALQVEHSIAMTLLLRATLLLEPTEAQLTDINLAAVETMMQKTITDATEALECLEKAQHTFTMVSTMDTWGQDERPNLVAVHNQKAIAKNNLGELPEATLEWEETYHLQLSVLKEYPKSSREYADAIVVLSECLLSLSETHLQMGQYQQSVDYYRQSMEWNVKHSIKPPPIAGTHVEDALKQFEDALEEYNQMFQEGVDASDGGVYMEEVEEEVYQRDDGYEGDIHSSLASLYLTQGDYVEALSHLSQAIALYGRAGEGQERSMADAKFQYSNALYHMGEYMDSLKYYTEALDIYQKVVDPGVSPLSDGLDLETLRQLSREATTSHENNPPSVPKDPQAVQEKMIDYDDYLQTIANGTSSESEESGTPQKEKKRSPSTNEEL